MRAGRAGAARGAWLLATVLAVTTFAGPPAAADPRPHGGVLDQPVPSTGCGRTPPATPGTTVAGTVESGGLLRGYLVHVPSDYRPWRPDPLVLSFHGHTRTAGYHEELSEFSGKGVLAVYPQGLVGTDGETAWQGAPYSAQADDVRFTSDLLDQLQRQLCVDPARIYATGKSNGGGFTDVLACRLGGRIAAFAPVAGAFYPQAGPCRSRRGVPVLEIHGEADTTIPYGGNPAKGLPSIPEWLAGWAGRDGCALEPRTRQVREGVWVSRWLHCARPGALVHYRIEGLGHDWPSTSPNPDSGVPSVIDATPIIMRFFAAHRLNLRLPAGTRTGPAGHGAP